MAKSLLPSDKVENFGSVDNKWKNIYVENLDVNNLTTNNKSFDIESIMLAKFQDNCYVRSNIFTVNKTTITLPKNMKININGNGYVTVAETTININNFVNATNRAGKDVYVYACETENSTIPTFVISLNSTVPTGYNANNSRKIGGFHCLCVDVGTISRHTLSGYVAGDIIPNSQWDLLHRAKSANEGMVYVEGIGKWVDIYLSSWNGSKLVSVYGGACADGYSSKPFHGELFVEKYGLIGKQMITRSEFMVVAKGSNEGTNIYGSTDVGTTGGHKDSASRRMISNLGLEDCCGFMWQWTDDLFENYPGSAWLNSSGNSTYAEGAMRTYLDNYAWRSESVYNSDIDEQLFGYCAGLLRRCLVGGDWVVGSVCGSRCSYCRYFSTYRSSALGGRAVSEPRVVNL